MQNDFRILSAAISDRGLSEKRPENEDSFLEINETGIFAVADGVGGAQAGDVASQMAMEIIGEAFVNLADPGDAEDVMKTAVERANEAIFQMSNELPQLSTMATTIVALHLSGNIATIGHVGDSRLYRVDSHGTLYRETQDHSVVEEEVRAGRMTPEQAAHHPSRNIISRALGAEPTVEVDLKTIMVDPNTTFLICSDGITRHINDEEINALLFSSNEPKNICQRMKEICYERGAEDNLTAVIVRILEASEAVQAKPADFEQETVATARQPMAATAGFSDSGSFDGLNTPQNFSGENYQRQQPPSEGQITIPAEQPRVETFTPEFVETPHYVSDSDDRNQAVISYVDDRKGSGIFGMLIGGLALLLLGTVIGAAGYYIYSKQEVVETVPPLNDAPAPVKSQRKTLLDLIHEADVNPEATIKATQDIAKSPEEFYVLGRANLVMKNYPEAKKNFIEAKNRLAMADEENSKILANDIALGLAVVNTPFSIRELEKELQTPQTDNTNKTTNANINPLQPPSGEVNGADLQ